MNTYTPETLRLSEGGRLWEEWVRAQYTARHPSQVRIAFERWLASKPDAEVVDPDSGEFNPAKRGH